MLIDFHTHFFPDKLAPRTLPHLASFANIPYYTDGTLRGALDAMDRWGVDYAVVLHIATRDGQQQTINHFARRAQEQSSRLLCFGAVYPKSRDAVDEVHRIRENGLYGVKLHPAYQEFHFGDEQYYPVYEAMETLGLPLTLHAGPDPVSAINYAPAESIARVARAFPKLTMIAAHMGSLKETAEASKYLCELPNVYFDTAMSSVCLGREEYGALLRRRGADHIVFGTDCPWNTVPSELGFLEQAGLSEDELELIRWKNACEILHLKL